jgi:membrane protein
MAAKAWQVVKDTFAAWSEHQVTRLSASLAYSTLLSLAPLVVLVVSIAGLVFGLDAARGQVSHELSRLVGEQAGQGIQTVLSHARAPGEGTWSAIAGGLVLLFGASGVFGELQAALNTVWGVEPRPGRGVWGILRDRFLSFTMVMGVAFLLLVSLVLSAALSAVGAFFSGLLPGGETLWQLVNNGISLGVITLLFALLFKVVPDVEVPWRGVWFGAVVTALLFTAGKYALGLYLGRASVASPYGAAGSLVVFVIWVYYATQILLLGAEFTQVYARRKGTPVEPSRNAVVKSEAKSEAPHGAGMAGGSAG